MRAFIGGSGILPSAELVSVQIARDTSRLLVSAPARVVACRVFTDQIVAHPEGDLRFERPLARLSTKRLP